MDSFYGAPRQPPHPPTINNIGRIPVVPEVSVIENSFFPQPRMFSGGIRHIHNKSTTNDSFYKKHVRFKNTCLEPTLEKENVPQTLKRIPDLNGKTFKQIYMANVPDRHLDLSIFESPRVENKHLSDNSFKDLNMTLSSTQPRSNDVIKLKSIENVSVSWKYRNRDMSENVCASPNYRNRDLTENISSPKCKNIDGNEDVSVSPKHRNRDRIILNSSNFNVITEKPIFNTNKTETKCTEICTQTDPLPNSKCTEIATASDEPTIKDLLKIIQKQNEQIMLLQKQVNNLTTNIRQPEIESAPRDELFDKPFIATSPSKKGLFSFDVKATSFQFSFQPQHKFRKNEFLEPKIQEIVECNNITNNQSTSLHLDESFDVKDSYVSNIPSIAIEMDEYRGSDEDEDSEIGLTFYKDLMSQVNKALHKAQKHSDCQNQDFNRQTMTAVKQATLQHLKNIGVNLSPIQESSEVSGGSDHIENCNQSEISCIVQQLLMKYLPSDKLAKVLNKPKEPMKFKDKPVKPLKPTNTEFSFATLQYMKKYNLIDNTRNHDKRVPEAAPKILDVTALKLQPKLL